MVILLGWEEQLVVTGVMLHGLSEGTGCIAGEGSGGTKVDKNEAKQV